MKTYLYSIITVVLFLGCQSSDSNENNSKDFSSDAFMTANLTSVSLPFSEDKTPWVELKINPEKDTVFVLETGSFVSIPSNAFLDDAGNVVNEPVDFKIKEYNDPCAFFTSGIPMTISESTDEIELMNSAGMIDVSAQLNGKDLKPNPDAQIEIAIATDREGEYPLWTFEEGKGWQAAGKPEIIDEAKRDSIKALKFPEMPRLKGKHFFEISEDLVDLKPYLSKYKNFTFVPLNSSDNPKIHSEILEDFDLKDLGRGRYELMIKQHWQNPVNIVCVRSYEMEAYNRKVAEYFVEFGNALRKQKGINLSESKMKENGLTYMNAFGLTSFAKHNIDRIEKFNPVPYNYTIANLIYGEFVLFCVDYTRNSKFKCNYEKQLRVTPENDFAIMAVTNSNEIYFSSVSKCKSSKSEDSYSLEMSKLNDDVSISKMKKLLKE